MRRLIIHAPPDPVKTVVFAILTVISPRPFTHVNANLVSTGSSVSTRLMSVSMHLARMVASVRIYRFVPL